MAISHYNLGLLTGERGDLVSAEKHLRDALAADPMLADAAYRLCLIIPGERHTEALAWCRKAMEISPDEPNYAYTLAVTQSRSGDFEAAIATLTSLIERHPGFGTAYLLQGELYQMSGQEEQALLVYHRMSQLFVVGEHYRRIALERIEALQPPPATDVRQ